MDLPFQVRLRFLANSSVSIPNTADDAFIDAVSLSRKQAEVAVGAGDWWVRPAANSHLRQLLQRRCQQVRSPTLLQLDIDPCPDPLDPTILLGDFAITCLVVPTWYNVRHTPQARSTGTRTPFSIGSPCPRSDSARLT